MSVDSEVNWSISTHPYMGWSLDLPVVIYALGCSDRQFKRAVS